MVWAMRQAGVIPLLSCLTSKLLGLFLLSDWQTDAASSVSDWQASCSSSSIPTGKLLVLLLSVTGKLHGLPLLLSDWQASGM